MGTSEHTASTRVDKCSLFSAFAVALVCGVCFISLHLPEPGLPIKAWFRSAIRVAALRLRAWMCSFAGRKDAVNTQFVQAGVHAGLHATAFAMCGILLFHSLLAKFDSIPSQHSYDTSVKCPQ